MFLYLNGLHGADSQMKGFISAMGAEERWEAQDDNVKVDSKDVEDKIASLKVTANNNLAMCYLKLEKYERALSYATACVGLCGREGNSKASYRAGRALVALKRYSDALPHLRASLEGDPENKQVMKALAVAERGEKEERKKAKGKEKEMFKGAF